MIIGVPSIERAREIKKLEAQYPKADWSEGSYHDTMRKLERICHEEFGNDRSIIQEDLLDIVDEHFEKIER
mgnify:CR=1 FL=1